ncbi:MAG TPA: succinylglutamate desuccinylase/aspartoacylase family protein [Bacillota bacterium]|nr:MAG: Succinylglutamate desuccinylase / Aspartoacylase family protein [Firmicutes bacterium ADurb.Bin153]HNV34114.1 succinylglutamate desuccinylase/aspartoacylase family protein [Bacillota bacterium]HPU95602.1 succinylglutamate desuccinylase/aspartoacylase family protein [Bacillota bacterium]
MAKKALRLLKVLSLLLVIAISFSAAATQAPSYHDVRPGYGVTRTGWLSDYCQALKGTSGDTMVYYLESGEPGMDVMVLGGTHANEISGILASTLLVELAEVKAGRLIVIPHANNSAAMAPDSRGGLFLEQVRIAASSSDRIFKYGDRYTMEADQPEYKADPLGAESRNLNRVYPGSPDGTLTQKIAYGITSLIEKEGIDTAIDLHEANPKSTLCWNIISPDATLDIAVLTAFELEERGIRMIPDRSGPGFAGYSHWEWSRKGATSFLIETVNPGMESGMKADPVVSDEYPIEKRVGIHLETILTLIKYRSELKGGEFIIEGVPGYKDLTEKGISKYLR